MNPFVLLVIGLLLILLEFYLPGGIMGVAGGLVIIVSIVLYATQSESPLELVLFIALAMGGLALVVKLALYRIQKAKNQNTIFLGRDQEGYFASGIDPQMIGKRGIALSDLRPSGHIRVEGKQYQAVAQAGYITEGSRIEVIDGRGAYYIVKLIKKE